MYPLAPPLSAHMAYPVSEGKMDYKYQVIVTLFSHCSELEESGYLILFKLKFTIMTAA